MYWESRLMLNGLTSKHLHKFISYLQMKSKVAEKQTRAYLNVNVKDGEEKTPWKENGEEQTSGEKDEQTSNEHEEKSLMKREDGALHIAQRLSQSVLNFYNEIKKYLTNVGSYVLKSSPLVVQNTVESTVAHASKLFNQLMNVSNGGNYFTKNL